MGTKRFVGAFRSTIGRLRRRLNVAGATSRSGPDAYRSRRWKAADQAFTKLLRRHTDRSFWLAAASTQDRLKNVALRDAYTAIGDKLFPSGTYDSSAAFAISTARPLERDEVGQFLYEHAAEIARRANSLIEDAGAVSAPRYAFVYWNSADRPDVVEHCVAAMKANLPSDLTLVELNAESLKEWVEIDSRILELVDIPAHEADIIRLHLLSKYGGMWIDASCLLNPGFTEYSESIRAEDFFLFTYAGSRTGNWFIWATASSYRLQLVRAAMDAWFLSGRGWTNYFQFHDVVEMLYWTDERYRAEWDRGLHLHPKAFFECHKALGRSISTEEWNLLRHRHPVNKLSWRKYNAPELRADPTTGISRFIAEPL